MSHITHVEPVARFPRRAAGVLAALAIAAIVVMLVIVLSSGSTSPSESPAEAAGTAKGSDAQVNYEQLPAYPTPESSPQLNYGPAYPSPDQPQP